MDSRQHRRRRTDTQGRTGLLYYRDGTVFKAISSTRGGFNRGDTMPRRKKPNDYGTGILHHEVEALACVLFPEIQALFESEGRQREYAGWKAKQQTGQGNKASQRREHLNRCSRLSSLARQAGIDLLFISQKRDRIYQNRYDDTNP